MDRKALDLVSGSVQVGAASFAPTYNNAGDINVEIELIDWMNKTVVTSCGRSFGVDSYLDGDGDPCDLEDAVVAIAGPDGDGKWHAINLIEFQPVKLH